MNLLSYGEVKEKLPKTSHLLLGNGFSIACNPIFRYQNLYDYAVRRGLGERAQAIFDRVGTNNFEAAMKGLEDGHWIAGRYGLRGNLDAMLEDLEAIKTALVASVAETHLATPNDIPSTRKEACTTFLESYHNVFTTNYDLLLYWVEMHGLERLQGRDGFRQDPDAPDENFVVFSEHVRNNKGIFHLHGGLHLYMAEGQIRKHCWNRSGVPLIELIRDGIRESQYPLFVAEGNSEKKLDQIERNGYLSYCLGKLSRIEGPLVTFGFSFGDSDHHITRTIFSARGLRKLFVGIHGGPGSREAESIRRKLEDQNNRRDDRGWPPLEIQYFDAPSARPWGVS